MKTIISTSNAIDRLILRCLGVLALMLALAAWTSPARADNLTTVRTSTLPALNGPVTQLFAVDGKLIAVTAAGSQVLNGERSAWTPLEWKPGAAGAAATVAVREHDAVLVQNNEVSKLTWQGMQLAATRMAPLPLPLNGARAAAVGDTVYVAGLDSARQLQLLSLAPGEPAWKTVAAFTGASGVPTSLSAQNSTLLVSLASADGQAERLLRWRAKDGWKELANMPGIVIDGAVRSTGQAHVLYLLHPPGQAEKSAPPQLWSYHTITNSWARQAAPAAGVPGAATGWGNGLLWAQPAANDQAGQTSFVFSELVSGQRLLRTLDWIIIVAYLAGMLGIGWYCYIREKRNSTADFFVGGRSIPFWAAGISLYAANTSSISYIAIPAKAFETNWQYMTNNLIAVVALTFVAVAIVPLLRRLNLMSVFHYLEIRFHPTIRMLASLICILVQIGSRMSVILLLPSLAIATITGIDVVWSILLMGGFTIVYTAMGGMKAVVWTDFVQLFVKMGGALFAIGYIIYKLDGGVVEFASTAMAESKMKLFDFSWDLTQPTVWGFIFLVIFDVVLTFPKDQVLMQRALSTKSAPEATRSILTFAAISIPGGFIFYTIGTALFAFYKSHPERMNPLLTVDATFPLFIAAELPVGITGLIIAGILAAAMATLSGIMNSVATLASVDFYEKLVKDPTPKKSVLFAEVATVVTGLIGIAAALLLSRFNSHSLFDVSIELAGLLGGGFAGAYTLGMFTRRANWQGVAIGIIGSSTLTTVAWTMKLVHPYFYLPISIMLCIVIGYIASYLFPKPSICLDGLTIYSDLPKTTLQTAP
ncbi:MAG: sodium symporter family protein [Massilia sp.]|nr:sodium symporter family protein [Massilia sp.]